MVMWLLFLVFIFPATIQGQGQRDSELWLGTKITAEPIKLVRFDFETEYRLENKMSSKKLNLYEFGARFNLPKGFFIRPHFRISNRPENNRDLNRYAVDVIHRFKKKDFPLKIKTRFRYQLEVMNNINARQSQFRGKLDAEYAFSKKLEAGLSYELFFSPFNEFDGRLKFDASYAISKVIAASYFYAYEHELFENVINKFHILGASLRFKLSHKTLKKSK